MSAALKTEAAERGHLYALLATVFRRPLDASQLERLRSPAVLGAMRAAGLDLGEDFVSEDAKCVLDRLAVDYTQLFHTAANRVVPYEGIQTGKSDQLMGPAAHSVRAFLSEAGYVLAPESGELPDHVSVELAFMSDLAHREAEAIGQGDRERAERAAMLQRRFFAEHLGRWIDTFAGRVRDAATTAFYRSMATLLAQFVADEHAGRTIQ